MMMTPAGTVPAAKIFIMGVGVAGLQAIATARRLGGDRHRHRRPPGDQGAGRVARREVRRGRGRGVQAGRDCGRLREGDVGRLQGQAGRPGRRAHRQAGHRHHDSADPRPSRAAPCQRRNDRVDASGLGDRRSCRRTRRQRRIRQGRRTRDHRERREDRGLFRASPVSPPPPPRSMRATSTPLSRP